MELFYMIDILLITTQMVNPVPPPLVLLRQICYSSSVAESHDPEAGGGTKPCAGSGSRPLDEKATSQEDAPVRRSQGLHKAPGLGMRLRAGAAATIRQGCKETRKSLCATAIVSILLILTIIAIRELGWIRLHASSPVD